MVTTASAINARLYPAYLQNAAQGGAAFRILTSSKAPAGVGLSRAAHGMHLMALSLPIVSARISRFPVLIPAFERVMALEDRSVLS